MRFELKWKVKYDGDNDAKAVLIDILTVWKRARLVLLMREKIFNYIYI